jgi:hypothetical protein
MNRLILMSSPRLLYEAALSVDSLIEQKGSMATRQANESSRFRTGWRTVKQRFEG